MTNDIKETKITKFLNKYGSLYPDFAKNEFKNILNGYTINNDLINQIYCYLNLIDIKNLIIIFFMII